VGDSCGKMPPLRNLPPSPPKPSPGEKTKYRGREEDYLIHFFTEHPSTQAHACPPKGDETTPNGIGPMARSPTRPASGWNSHGWAAWAVSHDLSPDSRTVNGDVCFMPWWMALLGTNGWGDIGELVPNTPIRHGRTRESTFFWSRCMGEGAGAEKNISLFQLRFVDRFLAEAGPGLKSFKAADTRISPRRDGRLH